VQPGLREWGCAVGVGGAPASSRGLQGKSYSPVFLWELLPGSLKGGRDACGVQRTPGSDACCAQYGWRDVHLAGSVWAGGAGGTRAMQCHGDDMAQVMTGSFWMTKEGFSEASASEPRLQARGRSMRKPYSQPGQQVQVPCGALRAQVTGAGWGLGAGRAPSEGLVWAMSAQWS
jgi:hypothetical protein